MDLSSFNMQTASTQLADTASVSALAYNINMPPDYFPQAIPLPPSNLDMSSILPQSSYASLPLLSASLLAPLMHLDDQLASSSATCLYQNNVDIQLSSAAANSPYPGLSPGPHQSLHSQQLINNTAASLHLACFEPNWQSTAVLADSNDHPEPIQSNCIGPELFIAGEELDDYYHQRLKMQHAFLMQSQLSSDVPLSNDMLLHLAALSYGSLPALQQPEISSEDGFIDCQEVSEGCLQPPLMNHFHNLSDMQDEQLAPDEKPFTEAPLQCSMLEMDVGSHGASGGYGQDQASSPGGSAASSSIITDVEMKDSFMFLGSCINPSRKRASCSTNDPGQAPYQITSAITPPPSFERRSWQTTTSQTPSGLELLAGTAACLLHPDVAERSHGLTFKNDQEEDCIVKEPPLQRRKVHGITMEQVLQAEHLIQQEGSNSSINNSKVNVQYASSANGLFTSPIAAAYDVNPTGITNHTNSSVPEVSFSRVSTRQAVSYPQQPRSNMAQVTSIEPQSIAARHRRMRIKERTKNLEKLVPGANGLDTAAMFDHAIKYVHFLQAQMCCLEREVNVTSSSSSSSYPMSSPSSLSSPPQPSSSPSDEYLQSSKLQQCHHQDDQSHQYTAGVRRALLHRLLSSSDVQSFLTKKGLCLVTHGLAQSMKYDPSSLLGPGHNVVAAPPRVVHPRSLHSNYNSMRSNFH